MPRWIEITGELSGIDGPMRINPDQIVWWAGVGNGRTNLRLSDGTNINTDISVERLTAVFEGKPDPGASANA